MSPTKGRTNQKAESEKEPQPTESSGDPDSQPSTSRPKRNARKSVLYHNADYEVNLPGVKIEEDAIVNVETQSTSTTTEKRRGRSADNRTVAKKRKLPSNQSEGDDSQNSEQNGQIEEEELLDTQNTETTGDEQEQIVETFQEVGANEEYIIEDSLQLGAETEVPHVQDQELGDEPPQLNLSNDYDDSDGPARLDLMREPEELSFADDEEYMERPLPQLDVVMPMSAKKRGRPPKDEFSSPPEKPKKEKREKIRSFRVSGERVVSKAMANRVNQFHLKLFEEEIEMTELGDCYATVISGCLAYLLRKERIIDLLTNPEEIELIREGGWMLDRPARLPPLTTNKACYAFYIDGSKLASIKDISNDDLKPWSSTDAPVGEPVIKPNVRRHPVARVNNRLIPVKGDPRLAELHLTEYSAWLPRLLRLRKKIFYLSREGQIYGNVLVLYDYTCAGDAPTVINLPHGNDYLRAMAQAEPHDYQNPHLTVGDAENPFEEDCVQGHRGGTFLRVKQSKLGWVHNKKLLLKYLINDPTLLDDTPALNRRVPFLPPFIETSGVFVYFVPSSFVANQIHHVGDGLSPWTINPLNDASSPRVRSTRRALTQDENGVFITTKEQWQMTGLCLVETLSILARCPRLRKRVLYVQRNNLIVMGNVCYIYEYVRDGPIPSLLRPTPVKHMAIEGAKYTTPGNNSGNGEQGVVEEGNVRQNWMEISKIKADGMPEDEQFIDVEEMEVVEEEVIGDIIHQDIVDQNVVHQNVVHHEHHDQSSLNETIQVQEDFEEVSEDVLNNGWDPEFDDDPILQQDNPEPYFETPRLLETGHIYLTVRHKRIASTFDCVLEWIANTNVVEERGLLNYSKPGHPPIVRNARCYAFFVAGTAIFPHDINRDDFSPWSHNGTPDNPTCYRTKVRKIGVICDDDGAQFQIKDIDYKACPFHLVFLYSINPRDPRLRKKIYYMMETESKLVVSHALVFYDYNVEGPLPRLHGGYLKRFTRKATKRQHLQIHDVDNDVSDISETEKDCPFILPANLAEDGTMYLQIADLEFWNDRNRQLHFLVNKPSLLETIGCLNSRVPSLPPSTSGKGAFIFFVDGLEVDSRNLTTDGLVPWSENSSTSAMTGAACKRPKSAKTPLALNRENQLRVWKTPPGNGRASEGVEFQLHTYNATLPRCPRLKKKVAYVLKNGQQIGHSMIMYWFTESGEIPIPINLNTLNPEVSVQRLPNSIREEASRLLQSLTPAEVAKLLQDRHGIQVSPKTLYYLRRRDLISMNSQGGQQAYSDVKNEYMEQLVDQQWHHQEVVDEMMQQGTSQEEKNQQMLQDVVDEDSIQVGNTEEVLQGDQDGNSGRYSTRRNVTLGDHLNLLHGVVPNRGGSFLQKPVATGMIRGAQRSEAIWRITKSSFGTSNDNDTFDMLWKMMLEKNEQRLLHNVHQTFGIEIIADSMVGGEMLQLGDDEIVENVVLDTSESNEQKAAHEGYLEEEEVIEEVVMQKDDDGMDNHSNMHQQQHEEVIEQLIVEEVVDDHHHLLEEQIVNEHGEIVHEEVDHDQHNHNQQ
ncbi:unnamed protein product [Caenorhabditis angaria]|uniref:DUF7747 domain-containing protein n=1 Tax=Caenorhabditis angaria TaxID=860376 RepID=A0A9P1I5D9_9PELO|nr:unnamed protein product [Caenorhabditis angaria]